MDTENIAGDSMEWQLMNISVGMLTANRQKDSLLFALWKKLPV